MSAPTVVLDLTPLDTDSRYRGFGRYVATLARGLAALPESERGGLRLLGLTHLGWDGSFRVVEQLDAWQGEADVKRAPTRQHFEWAYRRRVALAIALRRIGARLVHLGTPDATPLFMSLSRCKKVVTCHDLIDLRWPEQYITWVKGGRLLAPLIHRRRYTSADHVVAISDESARDLERFFGMPRERITRVYNAIDHDKWRSEGAGDDDVTQRYGLAGRPFLIYVGDVDWRKNVTGMVHGLSRARAAGADVILAFAGRLSEEKRARVTAEATAAGVASSISFLDYVSDEDLAALYRRSLAHLFVSRDEGFGLTVAEAMACGAPVITTRGGSLAEVAGEDALLVDPEDHAAIGEAIVRLLREPGLRERLRTTGIARAARFSIERQAREMIAVYQRALGLASRS